MKGFKEDWKEIFAIVKSRDWHLGYRDAGREIRRGWREGWRAFGKAFQVRSRRQS